MRLPCTITYRCTEDNGRRDVMGYVKLKEPLPLAHMAAVGTSAVLVMSRDGGITVEEIIIHEYDWLPDQAGQELVVVEFAWKGTDAPLGKHLPSLGGHTFTTPGWLIVYH
jgi:hypothetical protein